MVKVSKAHLEGIVGNIEAANALTKQRICKADEYKDEKESLNSQNIITDAMELRSKVVPTSVSSKRTKKKVFA